MLGPLHSSTAELFKRDNGLEGVIKREREEKKRGREQENNDNFGFPAVWHSTSRDNDEERHTSRDTTKRM